MSLKRMTNTYRKVQWSQALGRLFIKPLLCWFFFISAPPADQRRLLCTPSVFIGNHSSSYDPLFYTLFARSPFVYVASDTHFRSFVKRMIMTFIGAIPKAKGMTDIRSMRRIIQAARDGCIIGIFAEGQSTWDGATLTPIYATAKLIKFLRLPVIIGKNSGAFFSFPRWSRFLKRGPINIFFQEIISSKDVSVLSVDAIHERICQKLKHDQTKGQLAHPQSYRGRKRAEYLERSLFVCPACNGLNSLFSKGFLFSCQTCSYCLRYTERATFELIKGSELFFKDIRAWNLWQKAFFQHYIGQIPTHQSIINEAPVKVDYASNRGSFLPLLTGKIDLFRDHILLSSSTKQILLPLEKIHGFNIQKNERIEFYSDKRLYNIAALKPQSNTLRWLYAIEKIKKDKLDN